MKTKILASLLFLALFFYSGSVFAASETAINNYFGTGAGGPSGSYNSFFGAYAGNANRGSNNTFLGYYAGQSNLYASNNTFLGYYAGYTNTNGSANTFIGPSAGYSNSSGVSNLFLGYETGRNNNGSYNIMLGYRAGYSNTTGGNNTIIGNFAGYNSNGSSSILLGNYAGYNNSGSSNTFLGTAAGYNNAGSSNTFLGDGAGSGNTTGQYNTFIGRYAGSSNDTASNNINIGYYAGSINTAGGSNVFLGNWAGYTTTGSSNVFIGYSAGYSETGSNRLYIDNTNTSSPLIWGDFTNNIAAINGSLGIGTMGPSTMLEVSGSAPHLKLNNPTLNSSDSGKLIFSESSADAITFRYDGNVDSFFIDTINVNNALVIKRDNGYVGLGISNPAYPLTVAGTIHLTSGGIRFPDASTITSANTINADTLDGLHSSAFALSAHVHSGGDITSGTVAEAYIDALIARDSELSAHTSRTDNPHSVTAAQVGAAPAGHNHDTDYVNITGDSMTGDLIVGGDIETDFNLYVHGDTYVDSDANLKKDIKPIDSSLDKILDIQGVTFKWKAVRENKDRKHFGIIAQQVEEVLPEVVKKGDDGIRKVAYMELIPVLIEAIKEQQSLYDKKFESQQKIIADLREKVDALERESTLRNSLTAKMD